MTPGSPERTGTTEWLSEQGPHFRAGQQVLDLGCADGTVGDLVNCLQPGVRFTGVGRAPAHRQCGGAKHGAPPYGEIVMPENRGAARETVTCPGFGQANTIERC